jgi:flagellar hook-associated protein 1 FlgK
MLSNLQLEDVLEGGSYQDIYGSLIERVGTKTSVSVINRNASEAVLTSTQESKASLVGVNLDEEAAKLIQFQQAYQASAQLISTSQTLFDTLLNSVS